MVRIILALFLCLFFESSVMACARPGAVVKIFDQEFFLKNCGGKIYPKCDSPDGLNQMTILEKASDEALLLNKKLFVVFGADWCGSCRTFDKAWKDPKNKRFVDYLEQHLVVVKINGDMKSAKDIHKKLNISPRGYPQGFLIDPVTLQEEMHFYPSVYSFNFEGLIKLLIPKDRENQKRPKYYGNVSQGLIDLPIEVESGFGKIQWMKGESESAQLVNQGVAMMHVFHYVDAYRSFKTATLKDPSNIYALVGQMLSAMNISSSKGYFLIDDAVEKAEALVSSSSDYEKAWYKFAQAFVKSKSYVYFKKSKNVVPSLKDALQSLRQVAGPNDLEVLTLATYLSPKGSSQHSSYEKALQLNPEHTGAIHYLNHYYEVYSDYSKTAGYAKKLAQLAPSSAHAQHMYGHILPRQGRWKEALLQFEKADKIHQAWAEKNSVPTKEDWHFSHNNDLMGVALAMLGRVDEAKEKLTAACETDSRACKTLVELQVAFSDSSEVETTVSQLISEDEDWGVDLSMDRFMAKLISGQLALSDLEKYESELGKASGNLRLMKVLKNLRTGGGYSILFDYSVTSYIDSLLAKKHGFDSWKHGVFQAIAVYKVVQKHGSREKATKVARHLEKYVPFKIDASGGELKPIIP